MSYFIQPVITNKAKEESLFALVNNQSLVFSRIGLGSGRLTANLEDLTNIQTPAHSIGVTGSLNSKENIRIVGRLDNRTITEELTVTEIGVFAKVGTRPEFLFMYTSAENGDIIPPSTVASMIRTYEFNTTISNDGELQVDYVAGDNLYANYEELANVQNDLDDHVTDASNPHQVSKAQVGLGNVENYGIATVGEAQAGTADNKLMTPSKTRDTIGNYPSATPAAKGLMSNTDKSKLDGVEEGANNYVHPTTHQPSIIAQNTTNRFVTDAEKTTWNNKASTAEATTTSKGLMSSTDKSKLNSIPPAVDGGLIGVITGKDFENFPQFNLSELQEPRFSIDLILNPGSFSVGKIKNMSARGGGLQIGSEIPVHSPVNSTEVLVPLKTTSLKIQGHNSSQIYWVIRGYVNGAWETHTLAVGGAVSGNSHLSVINSNFTNYLAKPIKPGTYSSLGVYGSTLEALNIWGSYF